MRSSLISILVALALSLLLAPLATAALYQGAGPGIKVEFRVKGREIVFAKVVTTLYCTSPEGHRHRRAWRYYVGVHRAPRGATAIQMGPIRIDRNGGFRDDSESEEEAGFQKEMFAGRVSGRVIRGRYSLLARYHDECRTGGYQGLGGVRSGRDVLRFHALKRAL